MVGLAERLIISLLGTIMEFTTENGSGDRWPYEEQHFMMVCPHGMMRKQF